MPGAAGEREQREDEADERRVDVEGARDAAADARDDAVVVAPREGEGGDLRSSRPDHVDASGADPCVDRRGGRPVPACTVALRPSSWRLRT